MNTMFMGSDGNVLSYGSALLWNASNSFDNATNFFTSLHRRIIPAFSIKAINDDGSANVGAMVWDSVVGTVVVPLQLAADFAGIVPLILKDVAEQGYYFNETEALKQNSIQEERMEKNSSVDDISGSGEDQTLMKWCYDSVINLKNFINKSNESYRDVVNELLASGSDSGELVKGVSTAIRFGALVSVDIVAHFANTLLHLVELPTESLIAATTNTEFLMENRQYHDTLFLFISEEDYNTMPVTP